MRIARTGMGLLAAIAMWGCSGPSTTTPSAPVYQQPEQAAALAPALPLVTLNGSGFSIGCPGPWYTQFDTPDAAFTCQSPQAIDGFSAVCTLSVSPYEPGTMEIWPDIVANLGSSFQSFQLEHQDAFYSGDLHGFTVAYTYYDPSSRRRIKVVQFMTTDDTDSFLVTCGSLPNTYGNFANTFESIARSLEPVYGGAGGLGMFGGGGDDDIGRALQQECASHDSCPDNGACIIGTCYPGRRNELMTFAEIPNAPLLKIPVGEACMTDRDCGPFWCEDCTCVAGENTDRPRLKRSNYKYFDTSCYTDAECGVLSCIDGWCRDPKTIDTPRCQ